MAREAQPLRRSQFITTYGPGAILEGPNGPRLMPTIDRSGIFDGRRAAEFEIPDSRLSQSLLNGVGIVRLPSNAELQRLEVAAIYSTMRFPAWSICQLHQVLYRKSIGNAKSCPNCAEHSSPQEAWRRSSSDAVRFLRACEAGHLDDIDWNQLVRHRGACSPTYLYWRGGGGSIGQIRIECPVCREDEALAQLYRGNVTCSGRFPELGQSSGVSCANAASIVQRGAANLRLPEIVSAITIPEAATELFRALDATASRALIMAQSIDTKAALHQMFDSLPAVIISAKTKRLIAEATDQEVEVALGRILMSANELSKFSFLADEFTALKMAAEHGASNYASGLPPRKLQFEVISSAAVSVTLRDGQQLRVTPVTRLRVVLAQIGYRRLSGASLVERSFESDGRAWYPGIETFGEGIFIHHVASSPTLAFGASAINWDERHTLELSNAQGDSARFALRTFNSSFVFWHTLAHRLLVTLAVDSGYSLASLRERIYSAGTAPGSAGGILIYTSQQGGDGTLGGLVSLVTSAQEWFDDALSNIDTCSNDPICSAQSISLEALNGASCYACCFAPETSCEHRNLFLDRRIVM